MKKKRNKCLACPVMKSNLFLSRVVWEMVSYNIRSESGDDSTAEDIVTGAQPPTAHAGMTKKSGQHPDGLIHYQ